MSAIASRYSNVMSESGYIRAIAFFTLVVAMVVAGGSVVSYDWNMTWLLLIGTFVGAVVGILTFQFSDNPVVSFVGVSGMSLALGLMMGPLLRHYDAPTIFQAVLITALIMGVMSVVGILIPAFFRSWGPYLLGALSLLIVAQFAQIIFVAIGFTQAVHMPILNWIGIAIFTAYVAYDWSVALDQDHTLDNAIDASGGLILDAVNLFLRILASSNSNSSNN